MCGGRRGIRTPGSLHFNGFQDRRIRPLCHPSIDFVIYSYFHRFGAGTAPKRNGLTKSCLRQTISIPSLRSLPDAPLRPLLHPSIDLVVYSYFHRFGTGTAPKRNGLTKSCLRQSISIPSLRSLQDTPHSTALPSFHIQLFAVFLSRIDKIRTQQQKYYTLQKKIRQVLPIAIRKNFLRGRHETPN